MAYTFKLRPVGGTVPFSEIDVSTRLAPYESDPDDYDAKSRNTRGRLTRVLRGMGRHFILPNLYQLTESEVEVLKRMKQERMRIALSPNWNANTLLYARYNRLDPGSGLPSTVYGPAPTFARSASSTNISATQQRADGRFDLLAVNRARFEPSETTNAFSPMQGLRSFGQHKNYFGQSHPKSGALIWTLTNTSGQASWVWDANLPRMVTDASSGAGRFIGRANPDFISFAVAAYDAAPFISVGVWVIGEGTVSLQLTGGATATSADLVLQPNVWQLLSLEGIAASGAAVTVRINAKVTQTFCGVGGAQFNGSRRLLGYAHNIANTTVYQIGVDDLYYDLQLPVFGTTIHVGLEMPDLVVGGEQCVLGVDQGGGNRLVLRYRADTNKFSFQKTALGTAVGEWTPQKSAGQGTVISISAQKNGYRIYENGVQVFNTGFGIPEPIARGLHVGWDGVAGNEDEAWNGLIYFVRVDQAPFDLAEVNYVSSLYNDAQQINWTRWCEGRIFEIATPAHKMEAGINFANLELEQVDSIYGATHEVP